jgi:hypothetical protein
MARQDSNRRFTLQGRSEQDTLSKGNDYIGGKMIIKELENLKREVLTLKEELKRLKEEHRNARIQELKQTAPLNPLNISSTRYTL